MKAQFCRAIVRSVTGVTTRRKVQPHYSFVKQKMQPQYTFLLGKVFVTELFNRIVEAFGTDNGAEIGRKLKLSKNLVYRWRDGLGLPTSETLLDIFECTGVSLHWLMLGEGEKYLGQSVTNVTKTIATKPEAVDTAEGEWTLSSSLVNGKLHLRLQRGDSEVNYVVASMTHEFK